MGMSIEKVTPWTPSVELPEILKGSYGRHVTDDFACVVQGNLVVVKAFKRISFVSPVECYKMNKLDGSEFSGTLEAGEAAIGILK